ncbi:hypothetical protein [Nocardia carnea]|uniref:hypothetical protein n=1 Tax=Nocardia carnea TaxID=37328 RepID=UPI0024556741|nr:hypothetical protein [Nocardia carnea]
MTDDDVLRNAERCLEGLRSFEALAPAVEVPTMQQEVDHVIARWRAEHGREVHRA